MKVKTRIRRITMTLEALEAAIEDRFTVRPVTLDDIPAAVAFMNRVDAADIGHGTVTEADLRREWEFDRFDLATSTMAAFTSDGRMVAYGELWDTHEVPVRPWYWARVDPDYRGQGIGAYLFQWCEKLAPRVFDKAPDDARIVLQAGALKTTTDADALLRECGMFTERGSYTMLIEMDEAPQPARWPEDIHITTFAEYNHPRQVFDATRAAFMDHRGYIEADPEDSYKRWQHFALGDEDLDPSLWFLAMDGDKIIGVSLCRPKSHENPEHGYVSTLGVIRDYRRKGIALALLHHTFGVFWERGRKDVSLHVDASSLTNATALYERAGMHVHKEYRMYEKELRPGVEYSKQE
jgi:ribosomal protein S18 acetylase RimI-like enzyme